MYNLLAVSFGEIVLKGKNRGYFEKKLIDQIRFNLKEFRDIKIFKDQGKVFIETKHEEDMEGMIEKVRKIFGIVIMSPCIKLEKDVEKMGEKSVELLKYLSTKSEVKSFKVDAKRSDKGFPLNSIDINCIIGEKILDEFQNIKVDVHNPDVYIYIDIKEKCYIYSERVKTVGGIPIGTNGRGLLLLSGGIDSPVAGYMIAKRGVEIDALYFHTYPFTTERANEKVKQLAEILEEYCGKIKLYSINILEIHKAIKQSCPEKDTTILARRFMMRIAERIARENDISALITGESLGQVASQTMDSMCVIENAIEIPTLKPVIGMDKTEIMEIARNIGTYDTSILPHDDCCSVFAPKHPSIHPKLSNILKSESCLDVELLIEKVYDTLEIL